MRCDMCPLCPTAEDDVCAIAETEEWGIEHKDGMMGCRHPYNWCKKKADEYADYLGQMGHEMGMMWDAENKGFKEGYAKAKLETIKFCRKKVNAELFHIKCDKTLESVILALDTMFEDLIEETIKEDSTDD